MAIFHIIPQDAPIERFEIDPCDSEMSNKMVISSNWDVPGGGLERARNEYQGGHRYPIHVEVYNCNESIVESVGISIDAAREIIMTLNSMVDYITTEGEQ